MVYQLEKDESVSDGISRLILEEVTNINNQLTNQNIDHHIGVHEARKSCKKVRAALRIVRDEIGNNLFKQENIRYRDIARKLALVRDSWVKIEVLDRLTPEMTKTLPELIIEAFRNHLIQDYDDAVHREKEDMHLVPMIQESIHTSIEVLENLPIQHEGFSAMRSGIHRTYARGRKGLVNSTLVPTPENFHEWRKRVKYLWHQVEILFNIHPDEMAELALKLHTLSDYLGDHHDLVVLRKTVQVYNEDFNEDVETMELVGLIDTKRLDMEFQAIRHGEKIFIHSPNSFLEKLERYWETWNLSRINL